jgi:hypothetical protein
MVDTLSEILTYYVLITTAVMLLFVVLTVILMKRDKHYAIALAFSEVSMYVALSTFGQAPLSSAVVSIGGLETSVDLGRGPEPPFLAAVAVIFLSGLLAVSMMALRTWDKQVPRNPDA